MRILHTADVHLHEKKPETLEALVEILKVAKQRSADLVTISGDLFDSDEDAHVLRPKLREIFDNSQKEVLIISGNHDRSSFDSTFDFGSTVVIAKSPFQTFKHDGVHIIAVPFTDYPSEELLSKIRKTSKKHIGILLLHCTLDIGFSQTDFGETEGPSYFPITTATLSKLNYEYVLAGHFHKETSIVSLPNGGTFIYPGSPISHSLKECGTRHVVLIDTDAEKCTKIPLKTFFYDRLEVEFSPGKEDEKLTEISHWIDEKASKNCELHVLAKGFISGDEQKIAQKLQALGSSVKLENQCQDVRWVLEHPLFLRFKSKLDERDDVENKDEVEQRAIDAMARLLARRELSL